MNPNFADGLSEKRAAIQARNRKKKGGGGLGTIIAPDPPVTSAPMTMPAYANFGQKDPD